VTQASTAVRRDSTSHRAATAPTVLAVIPTRNAGPRFAETLQALRGTPVLVLDTASTDGTPERARSHGAQVRAIAPEAFNHATTRNLALEYPADFYLFLTQDAVPVGSDLTCALLEPMEDPQVAMAYGRHLPPSQCRPEERFARLYHYPPHSQVRTRAHIPRLGIHAFFASNVCCLYRASVFRALGGFTPGLPTNEDMEFAARALLAGYAVAYAAEACVWHGHHLSLAQLWRRYQAIGRFFAQNPWILEAASGMTASGGAYVLAELRYLIRHAPLALPRALAATVVKYLAFQQGKRP